MEKNIHPTSSYRPLFDHMHQEHDLTLLESEMADIIHVVGRMGQGATQGAAWVNGAPKERKQHIARVYSFINEEVSYDAIIWPIEGTDHWWAIGNGFKFSVHKDKIVEWLDESPAEQLGKLTKERADLIREVNGRDLEGVNTPNNDHHY